jgi:hypothetical protein
VKQKIQLQGAVKRSKHQQVTEEAKEKDRVLMNRQRVLRLFEGNRQKNGGNKQ